MRKVLLRMFVICFMVQSTMISAHAQESIDIDQFNNTYIDTESEGLSEDQYQQLIDLEESGGDILKEREEILNNMANSVELQQGSDLDIRDSETSKYIGNVSTIEELQKVTQDRVKGKGKWAYQFIYISKANKARKELSGYRINESIKPASTLKIFSGYLAFLNGSYNTNSLSVMLHKSDNYMADQALKSVAKSKGYVEIENNGIDELMQGGLYIMREYYKGLPDSNKFNPVNGSGLNTTGVDKGLKLNKVTAKLETALLEKILNGGKYDSFKKLLAQPGQFGTLKKRLLVTNRIGKVYAKTGTLAATKALAGYVDTVKGVLVFAIIGDELTTSTSRATEIIDDTVYQHTKYLKDKGML